MDEQIDSFDDFYFGDNGDDVEETVVVAVGSSQPGVKRKAGRHPMTWIATIQQDLSKRDIHINLRDISAIEKLESMCHDRVGWKARCSMREPRETSPLSSVSAQYVTSDCS